MKNLNGFRELQIEDTRNLADGVQRATLMNITGATGTSSGNGATTTNFLPHPSPNISHTNHWRENGTQTAVQIVMRPTDPDGCRTSTTQFPNGASLTLTHC